MLPITIPLPVASNINTKKFGHCNWVFLFQCLSFGRQKHLPLCVRLKSEANLFVSWVGDSEKCCRKINFIFSLLLVQSLIYQYWFSLLIILILKSFPWFRSKSWILCCNLDIEWLFYSAAVQNFLATLLECKSCFRKICLAMLNTSLKGNSVSASLYNWIGY